MSHATSGQAIRCWIVIAVGVVIVVVVLVLVVVFDLPKLIVVVATVVVLGSTMAKTPLLLRQNLINDHSIALGYGRGCR